MFTKAKQRVHDFLCDNRGTSPGSLVIELTIVAVVVALLLIPIGLEYLQSANISSLPLSEQTAIGSIGVIIVVGIVISILNYAMGTKRL